MNGVDELMQAAKAARERALAPYSGYHVGAAVRTRSGAIVAGCNVEVPVLGQGKCAEQVALFSAVAQGHREFAELAVATPNGGTPCGSCRQVIWDLCGDISVHVLKADGGVATHRMRALLPEAFGAEKIKGA